MYTYIHHTVGIGTHHEDVNYCIIVFCGIRTRARLFIWSTLPLPLRLAFFRQHPEASRKQK